MSLQPVFPLCFASFGLSLEREDVTMVIEDTDYLQLCGACFSLMQSRQQGGEEADFILQAVGNKRMYSYLHTRKQLGRL